MQTEMKVDRLLLLTLITNVLIPKAGFKIGTIPITAGSIFLALLLLMSLLQTLLQKRILLYKRYSLIYVGGVYWSIRLIFAALGYIPAKDMMVSCIVTLLVYPLVFWPMLKKITNEKQAYTIFKTIEKCLLIVMAYGILQYLVGIGNCDIPGITVNISDYIQNPTGWWLQKSNAYGGQINVKIVSTYQNGNIFGVALVLLFPVIFRIPRKDIYNQLLLLLFVVSTFLTGSRSVMLGMIFYVFILLQNAVRSGKISRRAFVFGLLFLVIGTVTATQVLSSERSEGLLTRLSGSLNWQTFSAGAGRTDKALRYFRWLFSDLRPVVCLLALLFGGYGLPYQGSLNEIVYISILMLGGIVGLIIFVAFPLRTVKRIRRSLAVRENWMLRGVMEGILVWMVTAAFEGAYFVPPTAIDFWAVLALGEAVLQFNGKALRA